MSSILTGRTTTPGQQRARGAIRAYAIDLTARLAQPVERKALNLVVVGSSPTVGDFTLIAVAARSLWHSRRAWRSRN